MTTYPGSDRVFNYYPATAADETEAAKDQDLGLGSHTDFQCFTLVWQDMHGGLQVLNRDGQWIKASPTEGTFVVNIGDYLMRLSNDRFKSTVPSGLQSFHCQSVCRSYIPTYRVSADSNEMFDALFLRFQLQ